ncbi:MAG TPA: M48 family metallopeptidase [Anaeromyxobacteraceae bacterium]|nr:M48 family metallopeptidase [Anaeromyxobacteraceae bacterium]
MRARIALGALLLAGAGCAQVLKNVPGGEVIGRQLDADAQRMGGNLLGMAVTGELGKKASFDMVQEHHLGKTVAATVVARIGGAPVAPEHPASRYLRAVGTTVAWAAAELRVPEEDRPYPLRGYRFLLVDSPAVNAVGCPGGFVVVTTGLVGQVRSEDELAAVLAHEVAHVQRGHTLGPVEAARRQEHVTEGMLRGTSDLAHAFFGKVVTVGADFVLDRGFGKRDELAADAFASRILAAAGYDPAALPAFLSRLGGKAAQGGFLSRHPPARERVEALGGAPAPAPVPAARQERFRRAVVAEVTPRSQGDAP